MKVATLALYSTLGTALVGVLFFSPAQADHHEKKEAAPAGMEAKPAAMKNIVDTASSAGSFSTLVTALQAAELVDTLNGDGPFTVFAPTDEAFAKLPEGTLTDLLKPENKAKLQAILTYHVVPGKIECVPLNLS